LWTFSTAPLLPIILILLVLGILVLMSSSALAPFIYPLF